MANKNSSNFDLDLSQGGYKVVASAAQATQNFQGMDSYVSAACFNANTNAVVANTVTETTLVPLGLGATTLPVNFLEVCKSIEVTAWGFMTNTGTPTLRLRLKLGSVTVADTTAATMSTITGTMAWKYEGTIDCRTVGATGTVMAQGKIEYFTTVSTELGIASPTTTATTINTTTTQDVSLTAQWGTASASNSITCTNFKVNLEM